MKLLLIWFLSFWAFQTSCIAQTFTVKNTSVLSVTDTVRFNTGQTVSIENGRIKSVRKYDPDVQLQGRIIDGNGLFLIPGLIDCYTHIHEKSLMLDLVNGVTTVVNAIGEPYQHQLKLKVDTGEILGPRIYSVGSPIASPAPVYHTQGVMSTEGEARFAVRETKRLGYDAVFTYVNINEVVYMEVLREAKNIGLPVFGHTPFRLGFENRFQAGQLSHNNLVGLLDIRSGYTFPRDQLKVIATKFKENNTYLVPTLTIHKARSLAHKQDSLRNSRVLEYELPRQRAYWHLRPTNYSLSGARDIVKICYEEGVKLLIGTDGGFHFVPHGFSYSMEMQNFSDMGIPTGAILRAATLDAAHYLNLDNEIGSIEEGKVADLVLLRGNPLEDINNVRLIEGVAVRGQWLNRERLDKELSQIKKELNNLDNARQSYFYKPKNFSHLASYVISINGVVAGEERLYKRLNQNGSHTLLSINAIDPPLQRITETEWTYSTTVTGMKVTRTGTEGLTKLQFNMRSDSCYIDGLVPLFGKFSLKQRLRNNSILVGPNTSVNIDMDLIGNLHVMLENLKIAVNQTVEIPVLKAELNSEEWGNDAIVGTMKYLIKRQADENGMQVFDYSCPGFNGDPAFTLKGVIKTSNGVIESVIFDESISVKRTK